MDSFNPNRVLHSNQGNMWFNGKRLSTLQSVEAKVTGDFEEVNNCGDPATYRIYNGYSGEGTFTMLKIDSEVLKLMPTTTIITALEQKGTNKVERIAYRDVTIDEMYLAKFEKKSKIEEEVPFKFGHFEVLETI